METLELLEDPEQLKWEDEQRKIMKYRIQKLTETGLDFDGEVFKIKGQSKIWMTAYDFLHYGVKEFEDYLSTLPGRIDGNKQFRETQERLGKMAKGARLW